VHSVYLEVKCGNIIRRLSPPTLSNTSL